MRRTIAVARAFENVSVLSVPMNLGQPNKGPDIAPRRIIQAGLVDNLEKIGWKATVKPELVTSIAPSGDHDELGPNVRAKNCLQVGQVSRLISEYVHAEAIKKDTFPLILGGDHCIGIGTIHGIASARKNTGVVWVDAHADINTPLGSESGNMHGMPVAFLMGLIENANKLPGFDWYRPTLKPADICYIGLRDVDPFEKKLIKSLGIKAYTMADVDRLGIGRVMEECNDYMQGKNVHLSFDIDGIDPFFAPSTGTAVHGGLTFREGAFICEELYRAGNLTSMELVEVDPEQHRDVEAEKTINTAMTLINGGMGKQIL